MTRAELVERMARAIWPTCTTAWRECSAGPVGCPCKEKATAALAAIEAAGCVVVPRVDLLDARDGCQQTADRMRDLLASPLAKEPGA
jgi:hypothetical protein